MSSKKRLILIVVAGSLVGCATQPKYYPITQAILDNTANVHVVGCALGVQKGSVDGKIIYTDHYGLCGQEVDKRIKSGKLTKQELDLDVEKARNQIAISQQQTQMALERQREINRRDAEKNARAEQINNEERICETLHPLLADRCATNALAQQLGNAL